MSKKIFSAFVRRTVLLLTFLAGPFLAGLSSVSPAAADPCSDCKTQKRVICSGKCDNQPDRLQYDSCVKECVAPLCAPKCKPAPGKAPLPTEEEEDDSTEGQCQRCLTKQLAAGCLDRCDRLSPRYNTCKKSCAKQRCSKECSLPDAGFKVGPPRQKYACEQCKLTAEPGCYNSMKCPRDQPGSVACAFQCVQEACEKVCMDENLGIED